MGRAAARAALRYGVAQGWILDETARGSVNIQEAVDQVTHAGQGAVTLHTRGRHGGPFTYDFSSCFFHLKCSLFIPFLCT